MFHQLLLFLLPTLSLALPKLSSGLPTPLTTSILTCSPPNELKTAIASTAGLLNAHFQHPVAYAKIRKSDPMWINHVLNTEPLVKGKTELVLSPADFVTFAIQQHALLGVVLYSPDDTISVSTALTFAGVHSALLLDNSTSLATIPAVKALPVLLDARKRWSSEEDATKFAMETLLPHTDTKVIVFQEPHLYLAGYMVDYVVYRKLFSLHMSNICLPLFKSHELFLKITSDPRWTAKPLSVMGYQPGMFECINTCTTTHTEVTVVSDYANGISFLGQFPRPNQQLMNPSTRMTTQSYNSSKTYISLIRSDGDNVQIVAESLQEEFTRRVQHCGQPSAATSKRCPKLSWTLSARAHDMAPPYIKWYYEMAKKTGRDSFILPPSGYGYIYPALIDNDEHRQRYLNLTIGAAKAMDIDAYVHWDWALTWEESKPFISGFKGSKVRGVFIGQVPWVLPEVTFKSDDVVNGVVVFKEVFRWANDKVNGKFWTAKQAADYVNNRPRGSLNHIYVIFNVPFEKLSDFSELVDEHVEIVDYRELIDLGLEKHKQESHKRKWRAKSVKPEVESVKSEVESVKPEVESVKPEVESLTPKVESLTPEVEPAKPRTNTHDQKIAESW